jgi:hypothetical protein
VAVTWLRPPEQFLYVREAVWWESRLRLKRRVRGDPDLVAFATLSPFTPRHERYCHQYQVRHWWIAPWDPYQEGGPIEAVLPDSILPGRPSLPFSARRWSSEQRRIWLLERAGDPGGEVLGIGRVARV